MKVRASKYAALAILLFALIILAISVLPAADKVALHTQGTLHPWLHLAAFALLGSSAQLSARSHRTKLLLLLAIFAFGWSTEFLEHLRDGWPVESSDVLLDGAGAILGSLAALLSRTKPGGR